MTDREQEQHLTEHFMELRKRIMITLGTFLVALCAAFLYVEPLYKMLTRDVEGQLQVLGPTDVIWVYLMIAGVIALAVTTPVAGYQVWRFVVPGLRPVERRITLAYIPAIAGLFVLGLSFGYFVIYPMVLSFLDSLSGNFMTAYTAEKYFRFMINMTVPFGVLFEMPVVIMFLTSLGILNPLRLAKMRKVAYLLLTIAAVTITPPDFVSDILVIVPLFLLYEISVGLSRLVYQRRLTKLNPISE
ncbi:MULTISPECIES: twin-arginine translocase subunit TatC [Paenibacillus]|uniref:Sec-independent protein translocase protein TatC n=2 Tax=Paenibacillus lactis TaxID=228574 RepID=G4HAK5_9BACL|nr:MULTISPECIES: twin-arginine translocase subunit TatC [Paenibacillus]EHB66964.1 Sec-independent protein translocase, TatC subunit [Paenibacillus lactis 154]MBP1895368.1 sec-independent protein translocase protein TatC [Paenibacillus lactis]MCM3492568.1 twin-arginine translocase subunit TatC [Paenibacillus lactis]GIO89927.1 Sec-independent protein translocase protein TatCd [Paenibacillus lactis]HAF97842.1 twin-arginine translocase subunit TatC [Paenibacillus lactis]